MTRRFHLVDVFGSRPLTGNPLAVVVDSDGLSTREMLELTRWIGFSETTFIVPPKAEAADYGVRIFTLAGELSFAGHPTLGSCHVWSKVSGVSSNEMAQECGAGLVRLRREGPMLSFEAPSQINDRSVDPTDLEAFARVLGIESASVVRARWCDNGPGWVGILLEDAETVLALDPDFRRWGGEGNLDIGVVGFHPRGSEALYEVRAFFNDSHGEMREDPVTGSLNASLAQWLIGEGLAVPPYSAAQGSRVGAEGRITVGGTADSVWVGGQVFDIVDGATEL